MSTRSPGPRAVAVLTGHPTTTGPQDHCEHFAQAQIAHALRPPHTHVQVHDLEIGDTVASIRPLIYQGRCDNDLRTVVEFTRW